LKRCFLDGPNPGYIFRTEANGQQSLNSKLIKSFTRRTSGHCLGTFQTAKLCFGYTPLQTVVSLTTTPQLSSLSLNIYKNGQQSNVRVSFQAVSLRKEDLALAALIRRLGTTQFVIHKRVRNSITRLPLVEAVTN
jgi:hypothetical protein